MPGQINMDSNLGNAIYQLAKDETYKNYVEIGTWNGQGSTLCFRRGLEEREKDWKFLSFETDKHFYDQAVAFHGEIDERFKLIYGRIIEIEDIMKLDSNQVKEHFQFHAHADSHHNWFNHDHQAYTQCENKSNLLDDIDIDVLLLDGGEFSTLAEFNYLKDKTKIIMLDDVRELKTKQIHSILLKDGDWECLADSQERNGYSIHKRKE